VGLPAYIFMGARPLTAHQEVFVIAFFLTAWANLMLFSYFDYESDTKNAQTSFATRWGLRATRNVTVLVLAIGLSLCGYLMIVDRFLPALVLFAMNLVLLFQMCYPGYFSQGDRFRLVGDSIFLIPLIAVLA
jgi:4-hydroxybenzoate polyprenyltransferase